MARRRTSLRSSKRADSPARASSGRTRARRTPAALVLLLLAACAPLGRPPERASKSTLGCMRAALAERDFSAIPDADAHCIAAALIAWRCSATEAMLASVGKEMRDAIGAGDAEWRDLAADRRGLDCARNATDIAALERCCLPANSD